MKFEDHELIVDSIMSGEKKQIYEKIKLEGMDYYKKDFEMFYLYKAFYALVGFMIQEDFEICGEISQSINGFIKTVNRPEKNIYEQINNNNQ